MKKYAGLFVLFLFCFLLTNSAVAAKYSVAVTKDIDETTNVRKGPGTKFPIVGEIFTEEHFLIISTKGSWYKVLTPIGKIGYMYKKLIRVTRQDVIDVGIIKDPDGKSNVRSKPSKKGKILTTVPDGEVIMIILKKGRWYRVITRYGKIGYIHKSLIKPVKNI